MGTRHTTALHAVNRPHAENVDETKISSDGSAIKAEGLEFCDSHVVFLMAVYRHRGQCGQWHRFLSVFC